MDVSDRRLQVPLTQEAKIASDFSLVRAIFAFVGFVSALKGRFLVEPPLQTVDKARLRLHEASDIMALSQ